jgi:hypothetical protein
MGAYDASLVMKKCSKFSICIFLLRIRFSASGKQSHPKQQQIQIEKKNRHFKIQPQESCTKPDNPTTFLKSPPEFS